MKPLTEDQERTIRWGATDADQRPTLQEMERTLLRTADQAEQDARQLRKNAEFIRRCLDKAPGVYA